MLQKSTLVSIAYPLRTCKGKSQMLLLLKGRPVRHERNFPHSDEGASISVNCYSGARMRDEFVAWLSQPQFTHALTLNLNLPDAKLSAARIRFGKFCYGVDRMMTGKRRVERIHTIDRFEAVAFPEHVDSNLHLHVAANFHRRSWPHRPFGEQEQRELDRIWRSVTNGLGTTMITPARDDGWARYITKEWGRPGHDYFLSSDFHPDDRVVYSLPALDGLAA